MSFRRSKKDRTTAFVRKANRYSQYGREMEHRVLDVLTRARIADELRFSRVILHPPQSMPDSHGIDFTVEKLIDGEVVSMSFGITISHQSFREARIKHPDISQFHFPLAITDKRIIQKVDELFSQIIPLTFAEKLEFSSA